MSILLIGCNTSLRHPRSSELINDTLELNIRQSYVNRSSDLSINDVFISEYFGTFDDVSVIVIRSSDAVGDAIWQEEVSGYVFKRMVYLPITVWANNSFYSLTDAYSLGLINNSILSFIYKLY